MSSTESILAEVSRKLAQDPSCQDLKNLLVKLDAVVPLRVNAQREKLREAIH